MFLEERKSYMPLPAQFTFDSFGALVFVIVIGLLWDGVVLGTDWPALIANLRQSGALSLVGTILYYAGRAALRAWKRCRSRDVVLRSRNELESFIRSQDGGNLLMDQFYAKEGERRHRERPDHVIDREDHSR